MTVSRTRQIDAFRSNRVFIKPLKNKCWPKLWACRHNDAFIPAALAVNQANPINIFHMLYRLSSCVHNESLSCPINNVNNVTIGFKPCTHVALPAWSADRDTFAYDKYLSSHCYRNQLIEHVNQCGVSSISHRLNAQEVVKQTTLINY